MREQTHIPVGRPSGVFTRVAQAIPHLRFVGGAVEIDRSGDEVTTIGDGAPLPVWAKAVLWALSQAVVDWGAEVWECDLSAREIGQLTSLGKTTVQRALTVLIASGYIDRMIYPDGRPAVTIVHHHVITHRGTSEREKTRTLDGRDEQQSVKRRVTRIGTPPCSGSEHPPVPYRVNPSPVSDDPLFRIGSNEAPYLYMRLDPIEAASLTPPPPSGAREGEGHQGEEEPGPTLSRRQVADFWNGHPRRPTGAARISDRMPYPDLILEVSPELARAAIEAYFDHAGQATPEWSPLPNLGWKKFREVVGPIVQWLTDPSLPEPGMGRGFSEARRSGRQSRQRPRLQLVTEAPQAPPAIECGWDGWEEAKAEIRTMMPRAEFDIWVTPCVPQAPPTNGRLRLVVPNGYFRDWLREKHMAALVDGVAEVAGEVSIDIITLEEAHG